MTDQDHANIIAQAVDALNEQVREAAKAGLDVEYATTSVHHSLGEEPFRYIRAVVTRTLGRTDR